MNKILKINKKDIVYDHKNASAILNKSCAREIPMCVTGGFSLGNNLIFCLEERVGQEKTNTQYVIAPMPDPSEDGIIGEINIRYMSSYSTLFCFEIDDKAWGVFSCNQKF